MRRLNTVLLGFILIMLVVQQTSTTQAQPFADRCAAGKPARDDLVVDWFIRCINEMSVRVQASEVRAQEANARSVRAETAAANAYTLATQVDGLNKDELFAQFFGTDAGQDWQHIVIQTAERDWQSRSRPFLADFTRQRQCQFGRAGYYPLGPRFRTVCP